MLLSKSFAHPGNQTGWKLFLHPRFQRRSMEEWGRTFALSPMKKNLRNFFFPFLLLFAAASSLHAQAPPQGINYQAVARNASGTELANTPLTVRIGIYTDAAATNQAYEETHAVTTNAF